MKIWRTQVGTDVFEVGASLPEAFQPAGKGLVVDTILIRNAMEQHEDGDITINPFAPDKVVVFALPTQGSPWHPEVMKGGKGRGLQIELEYVFGDGERVPYVARSGAYNEIVGMRVAAVNSEKRAMEAIIAMHADASVADEEKPLANGSGKSAEDTH